MEEHRLRPKYTVMRIGTDGVARGPGMKSTDPDDIDSPFVLMPRKDPAAFIALGAYITACEPKLANEIRAWMNRIAQAEPIFGTQGKRNFIYTRSRLVNEFDR